ncbi:MAG: hypothetical protein H3C47_15105 [Candidatus Cloacimonetes bacterium]|nr:hypothetical protein [Candidatus Cloacimonadota bacterium]
MTGIKFAICGLLMIGFSAQAVANASSIISQDIGGAAANTVQNLSNLQGAQTLATDKALQEQQAAMSATVLQNMGNQTPFMPGLNTGTALPTSQLPVSTDRTPGASSAVMNPGGQAPLQMENLSPTALGKIQTYHSKIEDSEKELAEAIRKYNENKTAEAAAALKTAVQSHIDKMNTFRTIANASGDQDLITQAGRIQDVYTTNMSNSVPAEIKDQINKDGLDQAFIDSLNEPEPPKDSASPSETSSGAAPSEATPAEAPAQPADPILAACDKDFGSRSSADLIQHLKSGSCADALASDPARAQLAKDVVKGLESFRKVFAVPGLRDSLMMGGTLGVKIAQLREMLGIRISGGASSIRDAQAGLQGSAGSRLASGTGSAGRAVIDQRLNNGSIRD